jgi:4-amino-4-deoxy-L-arabinose transferase-like glycosyltransferase
MASANQSILVLISGIFMGIAIFIKIPALTMIPLVGFLLFNGADKNLKHISVWLIPVI